MKNFLYSDLTIGQTDSVSFTLTSEIIHAFALITGDINPIHYDTNYAATTIFKKPIAHGLLSATLFSRLLGTKLPGPGTIYVSQELHFVRPVYNGNVLLATVLIKEKLPKNRVLIDCKCTNQKEELVLYGEALILAPTKRVEFTPTGLLETVTVSKIN